MDRLPTARMTRVDTESFLSAASELLAVPSTADRPGELHRALDLVLGFVGPGFTIERFEHGVNGEFVIIGEQSGLRIVTDSKGMVTVDVRAVAVAAHGAYPWLGGWTSAARPRTPP